MTYPSILDMLQAGVHFGHQVSRWHPKMKQFIFGDRNRIHIINLEETEKQLKAILPQVKQMAAEGKTILFVTTKPQARELVKAAAEECGMPFLVDRWLGGMLTNFPEMRKLIKNYVATKTKLVAGELGNYTKKEQLEIARAIGKQDSYLGGLATLDRMPDALFIPSVQREKTAVVEANKMNVPIIGLCDTNANPAKVTFPIPANDDAVKSLTLLVNLVSATIKEGKNEAAAAKPAVPVQA